MLYGCDLEWKMENYELHHMSNQTALSKYSIRIILLIVHQATKIKRKRKGEIIMADNMCCASLEDCIHYRRCFMSGEYCSKQATIQKQRIQLHAAREINAFVIMNFSNMSDVVYNWRIKPFIESLKKYLWIEGDKIVCKSKGSTNEGTGESPEPSKSKATQVNQINVIRADTDTTSNYVVCNQICQQMQMADLIIVDVSFENSNVFYEFGMAVALGKLILPICYSESFFEVRYPPQLREAEAMDKDGAIKKNGIARHIDCYPWRRTLFEHFGLRYRSELDSKVLDEAPNPEKVENITKYIDFDNAINSQFGFSDIQYRLFPYLEEMKKPTGEPAEETARSQKERLTIGKVIYNRLANTYNKSRYRHNTLVVYTLDGFLNEAQAGQCIINFYNAIISQMTSEHCFCGDRVGTLIQANAIAEDVKDAKTEKHLLYRVGEIIQLGINEATYATQRDTIKTDDYLSASQYFWGDGGTPNWVKDIRTFAKGYIGNKSIPVYPNTPVYVKRIKNGLQWDILEVEEKDELSLYFCLYHVMLRTLKYANELVVDISKTPLQSLFWLGAAHGSNVNAITVRHVESEPERAILTVSGTKRERPIFDVSGLWSAILRSYDTEGFYRQLALAQQGIEQHSKLMLKNLAYYEESMVDSLYQDLHKEENRKEETQVMKKISFRETIIEDAKSKEAQDLESYYRDRFWKPMLSRDHLRIYLPQVDGVDKKLNQPKGNAAKWDVEAVATLSHYLSVRTHIGEYSFQTIGKNKKEERADFSNFITIGSDAKPLGANNENAISLAEYICDKLPQDGSEHQPKNPEDSRIRLYRDYSDETKCSLNQSRVFKGFGWKNDSSQDMYYTQLPQSFCFKCMMDSPKIVQEKPLNSLEEMRRRPCCIIGNSHIHTQLAQLVLWREVDRDKNDVQLWVSITGASGPATLALSTVLVNETQRAIAFNLEKNAWTNPSAEVSNSEQSSKLKEDDLKKMENPLSKLQMEIRKKVIHSFVDMLNQNVKEEEFCNEYATKIKYSAVLYLSSVLYRYFLPFLSLDDEQTLLNGMSFFLASLCSSEAILHPLVNEKVKEGKQEDIRIQINKKIVGTLETILCRFRGVEALYRVKVKVNKEADCDSREPLCICPLDDAPVNCLFIP